MKPRLKCAVKRRVVVPRTRRKGQQGQAKLALCNCRWLVESPAVLPRVCLRASLCPYCVPSPAVFGLHQTTSMGALDQVEPAVLFLALVLLVGMTVDKPQCLQAPKSICGSLRPSSRPCSQPMHRFRRNLAGTSPHLPRYKPDTLAWPGRVLAQASNTGRYWHRYLGRR